ncbi:MAG: Rpn family recombination-promoting nuclease/putative transposase [Myxococcales bacterium]|nr:Rpn family recombination-promoting nuclease/putative transposase [Myxococcales bacterium]
MKPSRSATTLRLLLPAEVSALIDWSTLRVEPTSVVDAALADTRSDVLFSARLDDRELYLYLLLEHQSTADAWMPLRLLGYMLRIWEGYLETHPDAKKLPAVVPMLLSHSEGGWSAPLAFQELLDLDEALAAALETCIPSFQPLHDDLTRTESEDLHRRSMTALGRLSLFCLDRARRSSDLLTELARWRGTVEDALAAPNGVAALGAVLRYILEASETTPEQVRQLTRQLGPRGEEAFMTGAQILRAEAEAKGKAEGEAKGKAEGEAKGKAEVLIKLLELRFGGVPDAAVTRILNAPMTDLDRWVERFITATTLDDVMTD